MHVALMVWWKPLCCFPISSDIPVSQSTLFPRFLLHMSAAVHQPDSLITLFSLSSYIFRSTRAPLILQL